MEEKDWEQRLKEKWYLWNYNKELGNYTTCENEVIDFIKNLLSEREVFTKDELFMLKLATNDIHNKGNGAYDEIGEKIERMLSKLNR